MIVIGLIIFLTSRWARTGPGKEVIDKIKMKGWPFGNLFMKVYMARFARTGTTLVASGVPLLQMLDITGRAVNNVHIESSIQRAGDKVKGGKGLAESIENDPNFLPLVPSMIKIGEQSGAMEQMLAVRRGCWSSKASITARPFSRPAIQSRFSSGGVWVAGRCRDMEKP